MNQADIDLGHMRRAIEIAWLGQGHVEPNPMVGCVIAQGEQVVGEGWHAQFGDPHAEIEALAKAGERARGATAYVTLEPCCHHGKTPPCSAALIHAGIARVVVARRDPFPKVDGGGIEQLQQASIEIELGVLLRQTQRLSGPYLKLVTTGRPWIIAKWAMTLDGKIATSTGESRWITGPESRDLVHQIRGRSDAVMVGRRTAELDDPMLTARPPGPRTPLRIVLDSAASLSVGSQLVQTASQIPTLLAVSKQAPPPAITELKHQGCEIFVCDGDSKNDRLEQLLDELGRRRLTNVLVEGGGQLLGSLFDARAIDEVHCFIAPKIIGGSESPGPVAGAGTEKMADILQLSDIESEQLGGDIHLVGRVDNTRKG